MFDKIFEAYDSVIVFDVETSGLDFYNDQIIEFAAIRIDKGIGMPVETMRMDEFVMLQPGMKLSSYIMNLTGITDQILEQQGVPLAAAVRKFLKMIYGGNRKEEKEYKTLLIAHNAQFDTQFLRRALSSYISRRNVKNIGVQFNFLDTLTVYRDRHAYPHRLENAITTYNLAGSVKNSHRAIDDVLALWEVTQAMARERDDLIRYINLFGYNPKYGISGSPLNGITYLPQGFDRCQRPLYLDVKT